MKYGRSPRTDIDKRRVSKKWYQLQRGRAQLCARELEVSANCHISLLLTLMIMFLTHGKNI